MANRKFWLVKSEPSAYSFSDLQNEPDGIAEWDGVRNYQARNILRDDIKTGDGILFYHSATSPTAVVGTAVVVEGGYPDYTAWDPSSEHPDSKSTPDNPIWYMVDMKAETEFPNAVTLPEIRSTPGLENMVLVKNSRLSVQPVTSDEWDIVVEFGMRGS